MIPDVPLSVITLFIASTLFTVGVFQYALKRGAFSANATKFLSVLLPFWLIFQATIAFLGFYTQTDSLPPRLLTFGVAPTLLIIIGLFIFARDFILKLPLLPLTIIHVVRLPIEFLLLRLYQNGYIPQAMTFEGANFDILSGLSALLVAWLAFRGGKINKSMLLIWNFLALGLLLNVVIRALLAFPSPLQLIAFDQPNRAVMFFPFIWLPTIIVPIILFAHLASVYQLLTKK